MDSQPMKVKKIITPQTVMEGAGVKLKRSIATRELDHLDPFLLFDHFGSENPENYIQGFPMHPHRGIETVTYMLEGTVNHKDSIGNSGSIGSGDVQWMTSGGGIMHEEMPQPHPDAMRGFQLWVNMPARLKMTKPRYQEVAADQIPQSVREDGVKIKVIAGTVDGIQGAVSELYVDPVYIDVTVPPNGSFIYPLTPGYTVFAYVFDGEGIFGEPNQDSENKISSLRLIVFDDGDAVQTRATEAGVRFLLISGKPLNEPIARYGPFVMNTREEIEQALDDLRNGTFVYRED